MSKTDKELTIELLSAYITSWNSKGSTQAINFDDLQNLIKTTYKTIHDLPKESAEQ